MVPSQAQRRLDPKNESEVLLLEFIKHCLIGILFVCTAWGFSPPGYSQEDPDLGISSDEAEPVFEEPPPPPADGAFGGEGVTQSDDFGGTPFGTGKGDRSGGSGYQSGGLGRGNRNSSSSSGKVQFHLVKPGNPRYGTRSSESNSVSPSSDSLSYPE